MNWNYTGLRSIPAVPAVGVHPRVYFGPDQLAEVRNRLTNTVAGQELFTNLLQRYTAILRLGRTLGHDNLPSSIRYMPDGTRRIDNPGLYDQSKTYTNLVAGQTNEIHNLLNGASADTFLGVLGGSMAMEAFECLILQGQNGIGLRATNLAVAMDTWATYVLTLPNYNQDVSWWFGRHHLALAYDFNHWAMTDAQRANVRKAIARGIRFKSSATSTTDRYYGFDIEPEASTSNWAALDTYVLLQIMALEGETTVGVEGYSSEYLTNYFTRSMASMYKFYTYGWHPTGEMYEGMGKGWFGGARAIGFARRGYNFFGHPHLQKFATEAWPAVMQPFGYSWAHYDVLGGGGADDVRGKKYYAASDQIAMQWVYTNSPAVAFLWRNYATTAWRTNLNDGWRTFLDFRDSKFVCRGSYLTDLIEAACFVQNVSTNDWNVENASVRPLDWMDLQGSTMVARSGTDSNAVSLQFHTRQDFGGHTYADRGAFALSGLGRIWARFPSGPGSGVSLVVGQESADNSVILVNNLAMYVTPQEGDKMRIPAKLAGWASSADALFATCDSTYAYTWQWQWNNYTNTGTVTISSGYQAETNGFNHFRRSNNRIPEAFGNTPFVSFPHWDKPNWLEGIQRKSYNSMRQVIRTAGLVRGVRPYALIIDDIRKDNSSRTYKWQMQIPSDLTLATNSALPAGFNPLTDALLSEDPTNGTRSLLVRILSPTNWTAGIDTPTNNFWRLTVQNTSVQPDFKIMLYPFDAGDPLPTNVWTSSTTFTVAISNQTDTFTFEPRTVTTADARTVTVSDFRVTRGGAEVIDYRNQIEPFAYTMPPVAGFNGTPTNGLAPMAVQFTDTSTGFGITNRQWTFGDGQVLNTLSTNVAHTYTNPGNYTVTLVVKSAAGASTNAASDYIAVAPASPPILTAISLSGPEVILSGTNGAEGYSCLVLGATNLAVPLGEWNVMATNVFGPGGGFRWTNVTDTGRPEQYYRLRLP